jgi:hypothetical protein
MDPVARFLRVLTSSGFDQNGKEKNMFSRMAITRHLKCDLNLPKANHAVSLFRIFLWIFGDENNL